MCACACVRVCVRACVCDAVLFVTDAPKDSSRRVEGDTLIFSEVQTGSSAVYQCNASNQYGYLLSNAFVNVLGEKIINNKHVCSRENHAPSQKNDFILEIKPQVFRTVAAF